jgi:site-specific recombinase XerD
MVASDSESTGPPLVLSTKEIDDLIDNFTGEFLTDKSEETVGTYRRTLNEFQRYVPLHEGRFRFMEEDVRAYKKYLGETRELSEVSVSTYLTGLRRFCQYLVDTGRLTENPATEVKGNRRPSSHSREVLTEQEIEQLFDSIDDSTRIGKRDVGIIYLMLYAGMSGIEIVRANVEDLEQTLMGWYLRVQGKGHTVKDEQVPIDSQVMEKIRIYLDARGRYKPSDPLFISHGHRSKGNRLNTRSIRSRVNKHLKEAGVKRPGLSPHSLTHTAALIWLNDGMSVEEVKDRMRHGTLETTMIYYKRQGLLKRDPEELDIGTV